VNESTDVLSTLLVGLAATTGVIIGQTVVLDATVLQAVDEAVATGTLTALLYAGVGYLRQTPT
jgi:hypothetical protein